MQEEHEQMKAQEQTEQNDLQEIKQPVKSRKKLILWIVIILAALLMIAALYFLLQRGGILPSAPAVTIETPDKMSVDDREEFSLKLSLTSLKKEVYPAASFSISFDPSKLEFLGLSEGNVIISSNESTSGTALPDWKVNIKRSNETGMINILYLDMTGGKCAFSNDLLEKSNNVLLFLNFRLHGSVREGDILELNLEDAVFAAADEKKSLASASRKLKTVNGRIVVGR